jgi:ribosomal protein S18 acetylase RimI-like enzyme
MSRRRPPWSAAPDRGPTIDEEMRVPRAPLTVRSAVPSDTPALLALWRDTGFTTTADALRGADVVVATEAIAEIADDPLSRIVVAVHEGRVVGAVFLRRIALSPLASTELISMTHLQVDPACVRRGVGTALVEAAVEWAEQQQIQSVLTYSQPDDRPANRFLARLGFGQVGTIRSGAVATVRAALPTDVAAGASRMRRRVGMRSPAVDQVVAARRSQRRLRARDVTG